MLGKMSYLGGRGGGGYDKIWAGLQASLGPDSRSPRRFAAERDGQIENAWILDRFPGPDIPGLEDKLSVRSKVGKGTNGQSRTPLSDSP